MLMLCNVEHKRRGLIYKARAYIKGSTARTSLLFRLSLLILVFAQVRILCLGLNSTLS